MLIRYWLHEDPSDDMDVWRVQQNQALWMEKRIFEGLGRIIHGTRPKR